MARISLAATAKLLVASAVATLCGFILASVQAFFVPFVIEGTDVGARPPEQRIYTQEELDRAEREAKARMKAQVEDKSFDARALTLRSMQRSALWVSWLPWLVLPFVVPIGGVVRTGLTMVFPALMVATTTAPPESILVFAAALMVGVGARYAYARKRAT